MGIGVRAGCHNLFYEALGKKGNLSPRREVWDFPNYSLLSFPLANTSRAAQKVKAERRTDVEQHYIRWHKGTRRLTQFSDILQCPVCGKQIAENLLPKFSCLLKLFLQKAIFGNISRSGGLQLKCCTKFSWGNRNTTSCANHSALVVFNSN